MRFKKLKSFSSRPTTDYAKEGLFNILENTIDLEDLEVLDLFSGLGSISFEFIEISSEGRRSFTKTDSHLNISFSENSFFKKGEEKYNEKKYEDAKFLLQKSIVFNPKDTNSYLYLAKIYKLEENKKEEEKNVNTVLLLEPNNEEATLMLMNIELKKSNYSRVKELIEIFPKICKNLCEKNNLILESLKNIEPKNES